MSSKILPYYLISTQVTFTGQHKLNRTLSITYKERATEVRERNKRKACKFDEFKFVFYFESE